MSAPTRGAPSVLHLRRGTRLSRGHAGRHGQGRPGEVRRDAGEGYVDQPATTVRERIEASGRRHEPRGWVGDGVGTEDR